MSSAVQLSFPDKVPEVEDPSLFGPWDVDRTVVSQVLRWCAALGRDMRFCTQEWAMKVEGNQYVRCDLDDCAELWSPTAAIDVTVHRLGLDESFAFSSYEAVVNEMMSNPYTEACKIAEAAETLQDAIEEFAHGRWGSEVASLFERAAWRIDHANDEPIYGPFCGLAETHCLEFQLSHSWGPQLLQWLIDLDDVGMASGWFLLEHPEMDQQRMLPSIGDNSYVADRFLEQAIYEECAVKYSRNPTKTQQWASIDGESTWDYLRGPRLKQRVAELRRFVSERASGGDG